MDRGEQEETVNPVILRVEDGMGQIVHEPRAIGETLYLEYSLTGRKGNIFQKLEELAARHKTLSFNQ